MPKVSLIKLFDEAILPVFVIFGAKIVGLLLPTLLLNLNFEISFSHLSLETLYLRFLDQRSLVMATTISNMIVFLTIGVCFGWVLFRAHHLHLSHLHPKKAKNFASRNLDRFFVDSYELYHQAAVWLTLTAYVTIESLLQFFGGTISFFVFALGLFVGVSFFYLLFDDLIKEMETFQ